MLLVYDVLMCCTIVSQDPLEISYTSVNSFVKQDLNIAFQ